jgi:hypothetical protein
MKNYNEAKETTVFTVEAIGNSVTGTYQVGEKTRTYSRFEIEGYSVGPINEAEFIMQSAEETTSPRGVERKLHIRECERQCSCYNDDDDTFDENCEKCYHGTELAYEVWDWGFRGQYPSKLDTFETEAEAEDYIFQRVYEYDFLRDDQRDTMYFDNIEEAEDEMIERYAELWSVKKDTVISILHHKKIVNEVREQREVEQREKKRIAVEADKTRVNEIAEVYAKMIEKIVPESYKETAARLSAAIGERIESSVFHAAVKLIRNK